MNVMSKAPSACVFGRRYMFKNVAQEDGRFCGELMIGQTCAQNPSLKALMQLSINSHH